LTPLGPDRDSDIATFTIAAWTTVQGKDELIPPHLVVVVNLRREKLRSIPERPIVPARHVDMYPTRDARSVGPTGGTAPGTDELCLPVRPIQFEIEWQKHGGVLPEGWSPIFGSVDLVNADERAVVGRLLAQSRPSRSKEKHRENHLAKEHRTSFTIVCVPPEVDGSTWSFLRSGSGEQVPLGTGSTLLEIEGSR
jgi:hypothetical protein